MLNPLIKIGGVFAILGSIFTGSYFIRGYYNTERISHYVADQGFTLLNSRDSEAEWAKRWKDYINGKDIWKLPNFEKNKSNQNKVPQNFKDKCFDNSSLVFEGNENMLGQIEKYCTKSFVIAEILKKEGSNLLQKGKDVELWKGAYANYFKSNKYNKNPLNINEWNGVRDENQMPSDYQDKCESASKLQTKTNREDNYLNVKNFCTQQK